MSRCFVFGGWTSLQTSQILIFLENVRIRTCILVSWVLLMITVWSYFNQQVYHRWILTFTHGDTTFYEIDTNFSSYVSPRCPTRIYGVSQKGYNTKWRHNKRQMGNSTLLFFMSATRVTPLIITSCLTQNIMSVNIILCDCDTLMDVGD